MCRSAIVPASALLTWLRLNAVVVLCLALVLATGLLVGVLFAYHTYLMLSGSTTWEQASHHRIPYLKDLTDVSNPFDQGCCWNVAAFLCGRGRDWQQLYVTKTKMLRPSA